MSSQVFAEFYAVITNPKRVNPALDSKAALQRIDEVRSLPGLIKLGKHMAEQTERLIEFDPIQSYPEPPVAGYRARELAWRRTHREALCDFAGQWVVLEGEEIAAHGTDPQQVVVEARAKGIRVPSIFYVGKPTTVSPVTLEW